MDITTSNSTRLKPTRIPAGAAGRPHLITQDNGGTGNYGFREGKWKLVRYDTKSARNVVVERTLANTPVPQFQLFDLSTDPNEATNVIDRHPDVAERMKAKLAELIAAGRSRS